eukprot:6490914-Amphidinium_carterae.2
MHALQAVRAGPEFSRCMPAITHNHWGFIVPAERPSNWTVQDRTSNNEVITTIINSLNTTVQHQLGRSTAGLTAAQQLL